VPASKKKQRGKEPPPETNILGRVVYPSATKETVHPTETRNPGNVARDEHPSESPPSAFRRSLFEQVEKQPQNATLWTLLGWSSADAREAATYFRRALAIDPENPVACDGLEWALAESGWVDGLVEIPEYLPPKTKVPETNLSAVQIQSARAALRRASTHPVTRPRFGIRDFRWRTISRFYQIPILRNLSIAVAYLLLISAAEVVTVLVNATIGMIFHAFIMIGLIIHGSIIQQGPFRRYLVILAIAPLIRVLSLSLPLAALGVPVMYRYMIVGVPILMAAFFAARGVGLAANRLYFTWKGWPIQLLFSLSGLALGYFEYLILHPQALVPTAGWFDIGMGMFILFVFTGFLEEFIFRGLLQVTGIQLFGKTAIWIISILFGILHIGYYSIFDVVFAASVGLFFGYFALKTHSLLGISLAHGVTNITLYILLPLVLR
jgi:uncharacterized protein